VAVGCQWLYAGHGAGFMLPPGAAGAARHTPALQAGQPPPSLPPSSPRPPLPDRPLSPPPSFRAAAAPVCVQQRRHGEGVRSGGGSPGGHAALPRGHQLLLPQPWGQAPGVRGRQPAHVPVPGDAGLLPPGGGVHRGGGCGHVLRLEPSGLHVRGRLPRRHRFRVGPSRRPPGLAVPHPAGLPQHQVLARAAGPARLC
jgi:hypothetical protein